MARHLAFAVKDVKKTLARVVRRNGGGSVGEAVSARIEVVGVIEVVDAHDPEGSSIELQKWN